jgi:hypothetical protein
MSTRQGDSSGGKPPVSKNMDAAGKAMATPASTGLTEAPDMAQETPRGAPGGALVDEVAARLRAGELTPMQAVEILIDDALQRQLGPFSEAHTALAAELKLLLLEQAQSDPYLSSKMKRLGNRQ